MRTKHNSVVTESLVGSSRAQMRREAARMIGKDPRHPLRFLLDENGKFKTQRGLKHADLANRPDIVQMGHIESNKLGGREMLMLQGAWENQLNNVTIESSHIGGAVLEQTAVDIGGIAVDAKTARFWERIGWLKAGTVRSAPKIVLQPRIDHRRG
jgi:hypothetical protein